MVRRADRRWLTTRYLISAATKALDGLFLSYFYVFCFAFVWIQPTFPEGPRLRENIVLAKWLVVSFEKWFFLLLFCHFYPQSSIAA